MQFSIQYLLKFLLVFPLALVYFPGEGIAIFPLQISPLSRRAKGRGRFFFSKKSIDILSFFPPSPPLTFLSGSPSCLVPYWAGGVEWREGRGNERDE